MLAREQLTFELGTLLKDHDAKIKHQTLRIIWIYNFLSGFFFFLNGDIPHCHSKKLQSKVLYLKKNFNLKIKV